MEFVVGGIGFAALVLNIIPLISTGGQSSNIKALNWVHTKDAYISYVGISVDSGGANFKLLWSDDMCSYLLTQGVCDDCTTAFQTAIAFVAIAFVANVAGVAAAALAFMNKSSSTWRICGAVSAFLAMVSGIICVIVFSTMCEAKLEDKVNDTFDYGTSWILMLVVLLLKFVEILVWISASMMTTKVAVGN